MADDIQHTFKSIVPKVTNLEDLEYGMSYVMDYQTMLDKSTTPWEQKHLWPGDTLQKFEIDLEKIDRVYHMVRVDNSDQEFELIARMSFADDRPLYVYLRAYCLYPGFDFNGWGSIYLSFDADIFMKTILTDSHNIDLIYESMIIDGISVERRTKEDIAGKSSSPFGLQFLCQRAVIDHNLSKEYLPVMMANSLDRFVKSEAARNAFNEFWF